MQQKLPPASHDALLAPHEVLSHPSIFWMSFPEVPTSVTELQSTAAPSCMAVTNQHFALFDSFTAVTHIPIQLSPSTIFLLPPQWYDGTQRNLKITFHKNSAIPCKLCPRFNFSYAVFGPSRSCSACHPNHAPFLSPLSRCDAGHKIQLSHSKASSNHLTAFMFYS